MTLSIFAEGGLQKAKCPSLMEQNKEKAKQKNNNNTQTKPIFCSNGSNSFRRNDDPLICIDEEKFCVDKIRLGVLTSTSCVSHLCVNNRKMKNVKINLSQFFKDDFYV
jgi:CRISPR/Cas system CMR subunit Cmr4 (Cas7 group RAMP superfamily)